MSTTLKLRGGTTAQHSTFTGEAREVTVDTQKNTVVVHDGTTPGGHPVANQADITAAKNRANHTGTQPHTTVTGLGTAATADVTTSATDTTAGRLLKAGDGGLLSFLDIRGLPLATGLPQDTFSRGSFSGFVSGSDVGLPQFLYGNLETSNQWVDESGLPSLYRRFSSGGRVFVQGAISATQWSPWQEIYHTGNILGTVSQSGGVPTGAIIQRGSNANGEFVRYADGTQICWHRVSRPAVNISQDSVYRSEQINWTYPVAFIGNNTVSGGVNESGTWVNCAQGTLNTAAAIFVWSGVPIAASAATVNFTAIGRWY